MKAFAKALAGTGSLVWLILRRDRVVLPLWVVSLALLPVAIANTMHDLYPTGAERQSYIDIVTSTPTFLALYGHAFGHSLGAITAWRLGGTVLFVGLARLPAGADVVPDEEHDAFAWWPAQVDQWPDEADAPLRAMGRLLAG